LAVAEKANGAPAGTTTAAGFRVSPPAGAATTVTTAVPFVLPLVAVTVTAAGDGIDVGAVYKPLALSIVPPPEDTLHVNVVVGALARNALNCAWPLTGTLTVPGYTVTGPAALGVGVGGTVVEPLPPPQAAMKNSAAAAIAEGTSSPI